MPPPPRALHGLFCMALAVLFFSGMNVCIKLLGPSMPPHETVLIRSVATIPIILWMLRGRGLSPFGNSPRMLLLRGSFGLLGMLTYTACLGNLPLGNAILLTQASPIFAAWFAARFLGEKPGRALIVASALCVAGLALVAKPTPDAPLLWSCIALLSSLLNGATYTIVRASSRLDHHLVVVFALPAISAPVCAVMTAFHHVVPDDRAWLLLAGVTAFSLVAQIFMTMGIQREPAGRATNVFFLGVVLNLAWGQLLGDPALTPRLVLGAALITAAVVGLGIARLAGKKPPPKNDGDPGPARAREQRASPGTQSADSVGHRENSVGLCVTNQLFAPIRARRLSSSVNGACVVDAGCSATGSTPPGLTCSAPGAAEGSATRSAARFG